MKTVWKYQIQLGLKKNFEEDLSEWTVEIPKGAQILSIQAQFGQPVFWALIDTEAELIKRKFRIFSTGEKIPVGTMYGKYVHHGTLQIEGGRWAWHLFEVVSDKETKA